MISQLCQKALPVEVTIDGGAFPIAHDFRDGIQYEMLMRDEGVPNGAKLVLALELWFGKVPNCDLKKAIDAMTWFYRCGKPDNHEGTSRQTMSFSHDWDAIFSGFLSTYNIDLLDHETTLHWWKFRSMLQALPDDSQLMTIIGYRTAKIGRNTPPEQAEHIRKMKRIYGLPDESTTPTKTIRTEAELEEALAAVIEAKRRALDGDLQSVLP